MKKQISILLALGMLVGMLAGCGASEKTKEADVAAEETNTENVSQDTGVEEKITIHIADFKEYPAVSQMIIAQEEGIFDEVFADSDYEVVVDKFLNGPAINEGFTAGAVDIAPIGEMPSISGINNTKSQKIIGNVIYNYGINLIITGDSDITDVKDLEGKKIGYTVGNASQMYLQAVLNDAGLTLDDILTVNLTDPTDRVTALNSHEVDAIVELEPFVTQSIKEYGLKVLVDGSDHPSLVLFVARDEIIENHPNAVKLFFEAIQKANEWIEDNPEEAVAIVKEETGVDQEAIEATFSNVTNNLVLNDNDISWLQNSVDYLKNEDSIDENFVLEDYIDTSLLEEFLEKNEQ